MTRELDAEIAELNGWTLRRVGGPMRFVGRPPGVEPDQPWQPVPRYSSDLNALMELIRRRWPEAHVALRLHRAAIVTTGESFPRTSEHLWRCAEGADDTERLANAVVAALRALRANVRLDTPDYPR